MKYVFIIFFIVITIIGFTQKNNSQNKKFTYSIVNLKDTLNPLFSFSKDSFFEIGTPVGYLNNNKDTIIEIGKYSHCWTDTFNTFAIVFDSKNTQNRTVAINQKGETLFDIYFFDNYPDQLSEGLFRVKQNDKIGFANKYGQIIIPCIYQCAFPFKNGKAKVAIDCTIETDKFEHSFPKSENWYFINKVGEKI